MNNTNNAPLPTCPVLPHRCRPSGCTQTGWTAAQPERISECCTAPSACAGSECVSEDNSEWWRERRQAGNKERKQRETTASFDNNCGRLLSLKGSVCCVTNAGCCCFQHSTAQHVTTCIITHRYRPHLHTWSYASMPSESSSTCMGAASAATEGHPGINHCEHSLST